MYVLCVCLYDIAPVENLFAPASPIRQLDPPGLAAHSGPSFVSPPSEAASMFHPPSGALEINHRQFSAPQTQQVDCIIPSTILWNL